MAGRVGGPGGVWGGGPGGVWGGGPGGGGSGRVGWGWGCGPGGVGPGGMRAGRVGGGWYERSYSPVFVWRSKERAPKPGRIGNLDKSCSGLEKSCSDMEKSGKMLDKNIQSSPSAAGLPLQLELELVGDSSDSLTDSNKAINI